jgi:hypothetical protein
MKLIVFVGLINLCTLFDHIDGKQNEEYYKTADKKEKRLYFMVKIFIFLPVGCIILLLLNQLFGL